MSSRPADFVPAIAPLDVPFRRTDWRAAAPRVFYPCGGCGKRQAHRTAGGVSCRACYGFVAFGDLIGSNVQTRILALYIVPRKVPPKRRPGDEPSLF